MTASPAGAPTTISSAKPLKGILILMGAVACFCCMDASAKWLNRDLKPLQIAGVRYFVSLLVVVAFLQPWRRPDLVRTKKLGLQCGRALCLVGSTLGFFLALRYLPLTQLTSISFSAPLATALLAGPLLGERIGPRRLIAVLVGFSGVLIVTRPFGHSVHPAALFAALAALSNAFYFLATRLLAAHDRPETTMLYTSLMGTLVVSPLLPFLWQTPSSPLVWAVLVALGGFGALAHWLLILAHRHAPASLLAPFFYVQIIGAALFGLVIFDESPDRWTVIGSSIVIGSGLYLLHRERVRHKFPSTDVAV
ncbi:MAG: DMT family transporter [Verrucomicrobia bacterium]|nr:DMT family transporter [Verrucomicrobiota bacterium]